MTDSQNAHNFKLLLHLSMVCVCVFIFLHMWGPDLLYVVQLSFTFTEIVLRLEKDINRNATLTLSLPTNPLTLTSLPLNSHLKLWGLETRGSKISILVFRM